MARQTNDGKLNAMINRWKQMNFNRHLKQELLQREFYTKPSIAKQQARKKAEYREYYNRMTNKD